MSEHLLFLQAAGSDFRRAHDLVDAVAEAVRAPHDGQTAGDGRLAGNHSLTANHGCDSRQPGLHPERIAECVERAGCQSSESLLVALAAHATVAARDVDLDWVSSAAARIGDEDLLLETAGVVFAFNAINRIADARRVQLEYRFLREFAPIRDWVERRLASLTGLAYDLSYRHQPRHSPVELEDRLGDLFERLGASVVPDIFHWLSRSPAVLEGVLEMIEANLTSAGVHFDLLREAAAMAWHRERYRVRD